MRKFMVMAGLVVVAVACSSGADMIGEMLDAGVPDAGAQPTPRPVGKFVGYTSEAYTLDPFSDPSGGIFNTYAACQADFGDSARICTSTDVLGTLDLPAAPPEGDDGQNIQPGAWLIANNLDGVSMCWSGGSGSGRNAPHITPRGGIVSADCRILRVLACCTTN